MAKKANPVTTVTFTSLKDSAFQQAGAAQTLESVAQYALDNIVGFPKDISAEQKDELYAGYRMKFESLPANAPQMYAVINDHYVIATDEHKENKSIEKIELGVAYAFSYSSQEFGKLANTKPALHALIKGIRDKCGTYCSNRLGDLKRKANEILKRGQPRERTANKNFDEFITVTLTTMKDRCISAKSRGDATADSDRLALALGAFTAKWNS
jgi:hypothetical protein